MLAVIAGLVIGSIVNGGLINLGHVIVPLPPGADVSNLANLKIAMQSFGPEQFAAARAGLPLFEPPRA